MEEEKSVKYDARKLTLEVFRHWQALIVIALVVLYLKFAGYAKRLNKRVSLKVGKKTYWEQKKSFPLLRVRRGKDGSVGRRCGAD